MVAEDDILSKKRDLIGSSNVGVEGEWDRLGKIPQSKHWNILVQILVIIHRKYSTYDDLQLDTLY